METFFKIIGITIIVIFSAALIIPTMMFLILTGLIFAPIGGIIIDVSSKYDSELARFGGVVVGSLLILISILSFLHVLGGM